MDFYILLLFIAESIILLVITIVLFNRVEYISHLRKKMDDGEIRDEKDFIPMLVHELRAPLSVIQGASDLILKEASKLDQKQISDLLSQIRTSSTGLLKMVNDILDVTKLEAGKFEIDKKFADINQVLQEECSYFKSSSDLKNISLECNCGENVQSFSFDAFRIKQVLNNLLSNALKFTPEGGLVKVCSHQVDGKIRVEVTDTGTGISDEDKEFLFHKFAQAHNHEGVKEKGTGLGLVISKGIVEAHGGKIWIEDNKPKGSNFIFELPLS